MWLCFDDGIWLTCYFLNTIVTNETFSVILHLPDYQAISNTIHAAPEVTFNTKKHGCYI